MKIRCLVFFLVLSFFVVTLVQFCIPQLPLAYAQEEDEEDEEPMQAKPNPMQNYIKGAADKSSRQKGAISSKLGASGRLKATAGQEVNIEGVEGESMLVDPYDAEGVLMPIDPYGAQAEADSMTGASSVSMEEGVGSASWDPTDSPAGWDPFDKEVNLDSAEMHQ